VPAVGAVASMIGAILMAVNHDAKVFAGLAGWDFGSSA
jgi:hypothetical protein